MILRLMLSFSIAISFALSWALSAGAMEADPKMQLLFIGVEPGQDAPGDLPADLPVIAIDALPETEAAQQTVFAARLRASPVSTFVSEPSETHAQFEQFFLISEVELLAGEDGYQLGLAGEEFSLTDYANRVSALVDAFNPNHRRIGFLRVKDRADEFPLAIAEVQAALNSVGFDMMVVMIADEQDCPVVSPAIITTIMSKPTLFSAACTSAIASGNSSARSVTRKNPIRR